MCVYVLLWQYVKIKELRRAVRQESTGRSFRSEMADKGINCKGKTIMLPPYEELLHTKAERRRNAVYVSNDTHRKLQMILSRPADNRISMSAYVENVILQHFEFYRDEINDRHRQLNNDKIL